MQQQPYGPPTRPRRERRPGIRVLVIVLSAVVLLGLSTAILGARYLTFKTGPYRQLPNLCETVTGDELAQVVGHVDGVHTRTDLGNADYPEDTCVWQSTADPAGVVSVRGDLFHRHWNGSSVDVASTFYASALAKAKVDPVNDEDFFVYGGEKADAGRCVASVSSEHWIAWECVVRAGNVVLTIDVTPPHTPATARQTVDEGDLYNESHAFEVGVGPRLAQDVVLDL